MDENRTGMLKEQLRAAADHLQPGAEGEKTLRTYLLAMLNLTEKSETEIINADGGDNDESTRFYSVLLRSVRQFAEASAKRPLTPQQQSALDAMREEIRRLTDRLAGETAEHERLLAEQAKADADLRVQQQINERERALTEEKKQELEQETRTYATLLLEQEKYTPEIIAAQRQKNNALADQIAEDRLVLQRLQQEETTLAAQRDKLQDDIASVRTTIDAMPEERRALEKAYTDLQAQRQRIENALTECSEEKQAALRQEIETLRPQAEKLQAAYAVIREETENLRTSYTGQLEDNAQAEQALLDAVNGAIDKVETHAADLAERLRAAKRRADVFEENLALCKNDYDRYHGWLSTLAPAVEALSQKAGLSETEYRRLYETMDPHSLEAVQALLQQIEDGLQRLDSLVAGGAGAAASDQKRTQMRAEQGEEAARNAETNSRV